MRLLPKHPELGWTPYVWLIYLGFYLMYPVLGKASAWEWTATAAGIVVFLVLYLRGYWEEGPRILWCAGGIALLGIAFAPLNPGSNVFFVYASGFLGYALRPRLAFRALLLLIALIGLTAWVFDLSGFFWIFGMVFTLIIGGINIHYGEVARANAKLRASQEEVERLAKTAERERIARDLHDLLGHTLSLITLKAELAGKLIGRDPTRAEQEIREVERISRRALSEVRAAISGYRSEGLQAELARARLALESSGVKLEYFAQPLTLNEAEETALAFALREAVTNVVRHAGARSCRILLEQLDATTRLEVSDDGGGGEAPDGVGLSVMRERIEGLGGELSRTTESGTRLAISLPRRGGEVRA
jgi:two-component system sensor histidine kinase DesK